MSSSEQKNHWQKLMEQLGLAPLGAAEKSHEPAGAMEAAPAGGASAPPREPDPLDRTAAFESAPKFGEPPVTEASPQVVPPTVPPAEGSTKAAEHAVKPVPARRASDELHSHWGRLARSLGLKLDIDLPFLDTAETPAAPTPQTAASDESRDPLAYEVPPVQEPDTSPSEETHWQEHRGEFDEPESLDTLAEYEGVETSEVEPPSAGEPPVERRRRRRRRRRPRTPAGEAIGPQPDRLALDSSAQSASEPGFRDETSGPPDLHDTESPSTSEADAMAGRFKHAKIPTWEQAVGYIIDQNLAQRSRAGMDSRRGRYGRR